MRGEGVLGRPRVLFVFPIDATFVRTDLELLRTFCTVTPLHFNRNSLFPELFRATIGADIVFSWFALGFAAAGNIVAKMIGKKSIVVAGGWDIVGISEIAYGRLLTRRGVFQARVALSTADRVLAFSDWSAQMIHQVAPGSDVRRAYLGVDPRKFSPREKENIVVCVAHVSRENLLRKGLRTFVDASRSVPEARFVLVGTHWDDTAGELRKVAGDNITFPGWLPDLKLQDLLARAKVYVQPSYTEGFGLALAEAMACGCVPVVTRAGAMPEVVGEAGFYVDYGDASALARTIREALGSDRRVEARNRVRENFSLERRLDELRRVVRDLMPDSPFADGDLFSSGAKRAVQADHEN